MDNFCIMFYEQQRMEQKRNHYDMLINDRKRQIERIKEYKNYDERLIKSLELEIECYESQKKQYY